VTTGTANGEHLGERRLSTIHAVGQALAIGPMFSVALVLGGISRPDTGAGFNTALSVLIAGLGVLAIGYVVALFARRYSGAGAVYEYLTRGAGPSVGVLFAGIFVLGELCLGGGSIYLGLGVLGNDFWIAHISESGAPAAWIFSLIALAIVLVLNHFGIRIAIRAMLTFAAVSFLPIVFLAIVIIAKGGADGNTLAVFDPGTTSIGTAFSGVLLGILLFVGFEAAASISEESRDPHRSIPRAVLATILAAAAFYVLIAYAFSIGFGEKAVSKGVWAADPAYIDTMATTYVGSWLATVIDLVVILDGMALALAICVTVARGFFALARDSLLPSALAKVSRFGTPLAGNLMVAVGAFAFLILSGTAGYGEQFALPDGTPIFPSDQLATFVLIATLGSFTIQIIYFILSVVALRLVWRMRHEGGNWWRYPVVLVAIAMPVLAYEGALEPDPHNGSNPSWEALYWTLGLVGVALAWFVVLKLTRPRTVANAAPHAAATPAVPEGER
jgi:amino acid transporter